MAKTKPAKRGVPAYVTSEAEIRRQRRDKAHYIRAKLAGRRTGEVSADERAWLAEYEAAPHGGTKSPTIGAAPAGDAVKPDAPGAETVPVEPELAVPPPPLESLQPPPAVKPPPPPKVLAPLLGAMPTPPRVIADAPSGGKRARWQDRHTYIAGGGDDGREQACIFVASYWHGALKQMADALRDAGIAPYVEPDALIGALILTCDELLPPEFAVTAPIVAATGSSALLAQRFMKRVQIKAAQDAKKIAESSSRPINAAPPPPIEPTPPPREPRAPVEPPAPPSPPDPPPAVTDRAPLDMPAPAPANGRSAIDPGGYL